MITPGDVGARRKKQKRKERIVSIPRRVPTPMTWETKRCAICGDEYMGDSKYKGTPCCFACGSSKDVKRIPKKELTLGTAVGMPQHPMQGNASLQCCPHCQASVRSGRLDGHIRFRCPKAPSEVVTTRPKRLVPSRTSIGWERKNQEPPRRSTPKIRFDRTRHGWVVVGDADERVKVFASQRAAQEYCSTKLGQWPVTVGRTVTRYQDLPHSSVWTGAPWDRSFKHLR